MSFCSCPATALRLRSVSRCAHRIRRPADQRSHGRRRRQSRRGAACGRASRLASASVDRMPEASPERSRAEADSAGRNSFACAPLPVLRRPDDHCRNLRRHAPRAPAITDPDQDRHLMTVAALPAAQRRFSSPPTARWSRKAMSSQPPQTLSQRRALRPPLASSPKARRLRSRPDQRAPPALHIGDPPPTPKIPTGCAQPDRAPSCPFLLTSLSNAGPAPSPAPAKGRRPKPFSIADVADTGIGRSNWADSRPAGVASGRTGIRAKAVIGVRIGFDTEVGLRDYRLGDWRKESPLIRSAGRQH